MVQVQQLPYIAPKDYQRTWKPFAKYSINHTGRQAALLKKKSISKEATFK